MSRHKQVESSSSKLDDLLRFYARTFGIAQSYFWRLITAVRARSFLLQPFTNRGNSPLPSLSDTVLACARLAKRHAHWHRPPESWSPPGGGEFVQFRSLVNHLFEVYQVPEFMPSVWRKPQVASWEIELYLHLAAGQSVRNFTRLPIPSRLTKRAAAIFMQAPADLQPFEACRWSQIRSLGGEPHLARVLSTNCLLREPTSDEAFWESVLRFLIKNQPLSDAEILEIVQFIDRQRFQPAAVVLPYTREREPLQPEFSLQGRSLMSLRRHMTNWRAELQLKYRLDPTMPRTWLNSDIKPFRFEQEQCVWTIDELLTDKELRVEGGMMQHCVAMYIQRCARRKTTIWSLKRHHGEQKKRTVTIEVIPSTRTIWQAKGKRNVRPDNDSWQVIQRWAYEEGLKFRS